MFLSLCRQSYCLLSPDVSPFPPSLPPPLVPPLPPPPVPPRPRLSPLPPSLPLPLPPFLPPLTHLLLPPPSLALHTCRRNIRCFRHLERSYRRRRSISPQNDFSSSTNILFRGILRCLLLSLPTGQCQDVANVFDGFEEGEMDCFSDLIEYICSNISPLLQVLL